MIFYSLIKYFEKTNKITFCNWLRLGDTKKGVLSRFRNVGDYMKYISFMSDYL